MSLPLRDQDEMRRLSGVDVIPRRDNNSLAITAGTGFIRYSMFRPDRTFTTTQVRNRTGSTAAAATPTLCKMGLWRLRAEGAGVYSATLIAQTANDTTLWANINTAYTRSWVASAELAMGRLYAFSTLCVSGAATPSFVGVAHTLPADEIDDDPPLCGLSAAGQTDFPATVNPVPGGTTTAVWAVILP
jgi:hypothetical protein